MRRFLSFAVLVLAVAASGFSLGKKPDKVDGPEDRGVRGTVIGYLRQTGNAPHVELLVTGVSDVFEGTIDYRLLGDKAKDLRDFAGKEIKVTGLISRAELTLAGSSGRTRTLYFIEVESIDLDD
ncbi:MAG: hypothetical protein NT080_10270 [Spirochaetes bacterium]|nr:hypothetical protein [Spirochaetota bacterium]